MGTVNYLALINGERLTQQQIIEKKIVSAHTMTTAQYATLKKFVEDRTCEGHTSYIVENAADNKVTIEWCCHQHLQ